MIILILYNLFSNGLLKESFENKEQIGWNLHGRNLIVMVYFICCLYYLLFIIIIEIPINKIFKDANIINAYKKLLIFSLDIY